MTTTLTLATVPEVGAVRLTVTGAPAGDLVITRTDANGSRPVRLLPGQAPIGGSLVTRDYEAALSGLITYQLVGDTGAVVAASTSLDVQAVIVSVPVRPARWSAAGTVTAWSESRASGAIVHQVPDRPDPIVITGPLGSRSGTATLRVPTYLGADAIRELPNLGDTILIRQPSYPGLDVYATVDRMDVDPAEVTGQLVEWDVRVTFREVAAPTAPLLGAADWTLADVAATGTIRDVRLAFPTLRALAVGP